MDLLQTFLLSVRESKLKKSLFGGSISYQVSVFNHLKSQNDALKEKIQLLKAQSFSVKEKENLETHLAKAESEASFYLAEKTKAEDRADKADQEILTSISKI